MKIHPSLSVLVNLRSKLAKLVEERNRALRQGKVGDAEIAQRLVNNQARHVEEYRSKLRCYDLKITPAQLRLVEYLHGSGHSSLRLTAKAMHGTRATAIAITQRSLDVLMRKGCVVELGIPNTYAVSFDAGRALDRTAGNP
jgi:hypothetical protein